MTTSSQKSRPEACYRKITIKYLKTKRLLIVHNIITGQDIVHEFCETDFAIEIAEGEDDGQGELDIESKLFYRLD